MCGLGEMYVKLQPLTVTQQDVDDYLKNGDSPEDEVMKALEKAREALNNQPAPRFKQFYIPCDTVIGGVTLKKGWHDAQ